MRRRSPHILSAALLIAGSVGLTACGTTQGFNPAFRHVALRTLPHPVSGQTTAAETLSLRSPSRQSEQRCLRTFRHPVLNRCETWPTPDRGISSKAGLPCSGDPVSCRLALARQARTAMNRPRFSVSGHDYRRDCSGFVLSVLAARGVEPVALFGHIEAGENGVAWMYRSAKEHGWVHHHKVPAIGDLVFFSNTHDRNRDGQANDPLTHVGIVERVEADGTITFIHRVRRGTLRYRMNLFHPALRRDPKTGKVLNHHLRLGAKNGQPRLTGELFHAFATLLPDQNS